MTAKEKAIDLVEKYKNIKINSTYLYPSDNYCKQCALICVYEVIDDRYKRGQINFVYWKEVKKEINKL